jgi:hypothetical protein
MSATRWAAASPAAAAGNLAENIAAAVGDSQESMRLHQSRDAVPASEEPFHRDARARSTFLRRCSAFAGILGSCTACAILSWRRFSGAGATSPQGGSSSAAAAASGAGSRLSFLQRYLITPLIVPAALGIGFTIFRGAVFEREFRRRERDREEWELANFRQGELDEMVRIYISRGLPPADAQRLVEIQSQNDAFFVDTMMTDELGFSPVEPPTPLEALRAGVFGAGSFIVAAALPLLAASAVDGQYGERRGASLVELAPELTLGVTTLTCSLLQARMLLRTYTMTSDVLWTVASNLGWVCATYQLTRLSCLVA